MSRLKSQINRIGKGAFVEFRLTYEGVLYPSGNNNPRATHKHEIRKMFHRQLKHLWEITPHLKTSTYQPPSPESAQTQSKPRLEYLAEFHTIGHDYRFAPIVTADLSLWCGLEILFLRPQAPGKVIHSGDIDNRIKTLFDALRAPKTLTELGDYKDKHSPDETPMFCLLEDDSLVSKMSIETDTLLENIAGGIPDEFDARLVITVRLRPSAVMYANMGFL